jgi:hypothetical protein
MRTKLLSLVLLQLVFGGCGGGDSGPSDAGADVAPDMTCLQSSPAPEFDRYCACRDWQSTLAEAKAGELTGDFVGWYNAFPAGTIDSMKVIPQHPFRVREIRAFYAGNPGAVRLRITETFGRSYPAGEWSSDPIDLEEDVAEDLMPALEVEITAEQIETWVEFDVSEHGILLHPTQHYAIVNEELGGGTYVGAEDLPTDERSRALFNVPGQFEPYGADGNLRLELVGESFCQWDQADRWFGEAQDTAFSGVASARAAFADLDGDGHDDLILNDGSPRAFLGDGAGGFAAPATDPWPDADKSPMMVFADVDNDGDVDALAAYYVGADDDGDGVEKLEGDCDDADPAVRPTQPENPTNRKDDNCDGVIDTGTDTADVDADGTTVAAGDCDDTRADVEPGAPELPDSRDNDCDLAADEDFVDRILENDGAGRFARVPGSGVEALDPTTAAGFGDYDGDGNLDLYWGNWLVHYPDDASVQDRFFRGLGDGTFEDKMAEAGLVLPTALSVYGMKWNDYNNDGHQDIFVGNYHLYDNQLWQNQSDGTFVDVAEDVGLAHDDIPSGSSLYPGGHTYGGDWGDIDNDGDMDTFMANLSHPRTQPWADPSMFGINGGSPDFTFENRRRALGIVYDEGDINGEFADFDNDMDLDLVVASLYPNHYSKLYRNDGDVFTDVTYETGTAVHVAISAVWSDVDEDGDLDLVIASGDPSRAHLFINRVGRDRHWVEFRLQGTASNRGAVGARVTLAAGGVTQMRDVVGGGGQSNTQNSAVVHFGLGANTTIDALTVRWVGGATEAIAGATADGRFRIVEGSGTVSPP